LGVPVPHVSTTSDVATTSVGQRAAVARTAPELAGVLQDLRLRDALRRQGRPLTYRQLAARTGWSHAIIGEYLAGTALPPTDRFDHLVHVLGATSEELGALAAARDRVEELRRPLAAPPAARPSRHEPILAPRRVPRQLPASVPGFVGRRFELQELTRLANIDEDGLSAAVVCGASGVGKTALAIHWAHENLGRFPDGQLCLDLRGSGTAGRPVPPGDALVRFLRALGVDPTRMPVTVDEKAALYRTRLAGRRTLILLDDAHSPAQVRPLLPGSPTSMVLVTSRDRLAGLVATHGATRIDLDPLVPRCGGGGDPAP
jgi:transcriptional regulator with XRE-family HTH domain